MSAIKKNRSENEMFTFESVFPGAQDNTKELARYLGLNGQEFAKLIGVDASSVSTNQVSKDNKKLEQIRKLLTVLALTAKARPEIKTNEEARKLVMNWFKTHNQAFGMETPVAILKQGKLRKLLTYAQELLGATQP